MAYVPNPQDTTQPTDAIIAETAQAEFRALKAYVQTLTLATGTRVPVRQAVLTGPQAADGSASGLVAISATAQGADLAAGVAATLSWANGFNSAGAVDSSQVINGTIVNYWPSIAAFTTAFLALDYVLSSPLTTVTNGPYAAGSTAVTVASVANLAVGQTISLLLDNATAYVPQITAINTGTLTITLSPGVTVGRTLPNGAIVTGSNPYPTINYNPPQVGPAYVPNGQSILRFASGAALDDYGNTWTLNGAASIAAGQTKFDTKSLQCTGAAADYLISTSFKGMPTAAGWTAECWVYQTANPANNTDAGIIFATNAANSGACVTVDNNAGTVRWRVLLSSDASTNNISAATGASAVALNAWNHVALTYDPVAASYYLYINGVVEITVASAALICAITGIKLGGANTALPANSITGFLSGWKLSPYCKYPHATAFAVPTAAVPSAGSNNADSSDWFDTVNYKLMQVTAPSGVAGTNPTLTQKNRLYVGEAVAAAAAASLTSVITYTYGGKYVSAWTTPLVTTATAVSKNDNMGTLEKKTKLDVLCVTADNGYVPGQIIEDISAVGANSTTLQRRKTRNTTSFTSGNTAGFEGQIVSTGGSFALAVASWAYRVTADRSF